MKPHTLFLTVLLLLPAINGTAEDFASRQFTRENGLSDNAVRCLYQDEEQMIWLGTRNGLNLYNGNRFIVYKYRKGEPNCLQYDRIQGITGNKDGKIYILSYGVSELDTGTGQFKTIVSEEANTIYFHERLYVGIGNKIYVYENGKCTLFFEMPPYVSSIKALGEDGEQILIGTEEHGLYSYAPAKGLKHIIGNGKITSMFRDREERWWIGSWNDGVYMLEGRKLTNFRHRDGDSCSLSSDFVRDFCQDREGKIWIGTFDGLNVYDPESGIFSSYSDRHSKSGTTSVWSILCDHQGSIWVGTYFDGVYQYNEQRNIFRHLMAEEDGLSSGLVTMFGEDGKGNIWIATDGGGMDRYDPADGTFKWYRADGKNSISRNNVSCICCDPENDVIWAGTHRGGLNKLDLRSGRFTNYVHSEMDENSISSNVINHIMKQGDKLFLSTDNGVCLFSTATGHATKLFDSAGTMTNYTKGALTDKSGKLWIYGGAYGTRCYDPSTGEMKEYSAGSGNLSNNSINRVYQDSKGRLWLCSNRDGIDLYDEESDSFRNYDMDNNSLASNIVYNAVELPSGKMLFTTDAGFSILNEDNGRFINYYCKNGIPLSSINENALFVTSRGEILIGGDNGYVSFREEDLYRTPENYTITPSRLSVHGQEIHPGGNDGILDGALRGGGRILLKPGQTNFSIEYVTSDYLSDDENSLEYYMEGVSKSWTEMEGRPVVSFTNLTPGNYKLTVRLKNRPDGIVSPGLRIKVLHPWYTSWWAILLYIFAGALILYFIIRNYKAHVHLVEALKYEQTHLEDVEELNRSKTRFFTNISHEFRTPLTLINGNVEMLMQVRSFSPAVYNKILSIYKSSNQLQELITELLDFSKLDNGKMKIRVGEHNIVKFVYENYLLFREYARHNKITLDFVKTDDRIMLWYDPQQMQKVINNLISNAIKHTPEGGKITVVMRRDNDMTVIEVNDNGSGIPAQDLDRIFDRFYQSEYQKSSSYSGTGIGLALTKGIVELHGGTISVYSKPGEGTSFRVCLKSGNSHFSEEELKAAETVASVPETKQVEEVSEMQEPVIQGQDDNPSDKTMLIAEDNDELRKMLSGIFSSMYRIIETADGRQAWDKVMEEIPDIVLSDVMMPGMSGTDLCRSIKNNLETCHIPVVLLTARTTTQQNMDGLYSGADDYVTKPFNVNILVARCNNLVNNRIRLKEKFGKESRGTNVSIAANPLDKKLLKDAEKSIENHIDETDYNVDIMARETGVSRTKLFNKIKDISGMTPGEFILTYRLKYAAGLLLEHPEMNISEISDRLGFSSPRQFSKFFKNRYGSVPQVWRKTDPAPDDGQAQHI